ncbi:prolipoprotein diacylglyceryl transferase [Patescibacteria group bacterium]
MIPFFQWTQFSIGPVPIRAWGLMVALGILVGLYIAYKEAGRRRLKQPVIIDLAFWVILFSLIGCRVFYVLTEFQYFLTAWQDIFKVWEGGYSISGGFIGAGLAAWIFLKKRRLSFLDYVDTCIFGLPIGLFIGRLGCFFVFDHPGKPTDFFLGQEYLDGIVRHNHGLYLSLNGLLLAVLFFLLRSLNPRHRSGFYIILFLLWSGISRFFLDFYRATDLAHIDARIFSLTFAQYTSIAMVAIGAILWYCLYRKSNTKHYAKS